MFKLTVSYHQSGPVSSAGRGMRQVERALGRPEVGIRQIVVVDNHSAHARGLKRSLGAIPKNQRSPLSESIASRSIFFGRQGQAHRVTAVAPLG